MEIGNKAYGGRNGNQGGDDGYNFRGRGIIQLTGRSNYKDFTTKAKEWGWIDNVADFEAKPDLILQNGKYALLSAVYYWNNKKCSANAKDYPEISIFRGKHLYEIADDETNGNVATTRKVGKDKIKTTKSILAISVSVNGGTNHLGDRTTRHAQIKSQNIFKDF